MSASLFERAPLEFEKTWSVLQESIVELTNARLFDQGISHQRWVALYTYVYRMCSSPTKPMAEPLYWRLSEFLHAHAAAIGSALLRAADADLVSEYCKSWRTFALGMRYAHEIFQYLNRYWIERHCADAAVSPTAGVYPVYTLALHAWRARVFGLRTQPLALERRILAAITSELRRERAAHSGGELLQKLVGSLLELSASTHHDGLALYREAFETPFLSEAEMHYCALSDELVEAVTFSCGEYLRGAEALLERELAHAQRYVHCSTIDKLRRCVERALISRHRERIESHFTSLLAASQLADLRRMHLLLRTGVRGCTAMADHLKAHVVLVASDAIKQLLEGGAIGSREAWQFVDVLVRTLRSYVDIVHEAFDDDATFVTALEHAARRFVNISPRSPELLARFCHVLLDRSSKLTPADTAVIERYLVDASSLVRYLEERDVFQLFYSKLFAKRLIQDTSVSAELEECMIFNLKHACGYEFATKLQRMFMDQRASLMHDEAFAAWDGRQVQPDCAARKTTGFSVMILTTGSWPLSQVPALPNVKLAPELCHSMHEFGSFYQAKYSGRRLQWADHLARADVSTSYLKRPYEFQVGVLQLAMLELFNSSNALRLSDIKAGLGMADGDVRRVLLSLLRPKILILSRGPTKVSSSDTTDGIGECSNPSPANPSLSTVEARTAAAAALLESLADTAVVSLNTNFSSKALMVKLSTLLAQNSAVDAANEDCEAHKTICEDRRILIQASIVRIMKSKKQLSHAGLMCEVLSQLEGRFQVVVADIKRNIDVMIEKEYIERADALDVYRYV